MNNLLDIKLKFVSEKNKGGFGVRNLRTCNHTNVERVELLIKSLKSLIHFYDSNTKFVAGMMIDVHYNDIIAKSNRIQELFRDKKDPNELVVGARFSDATEGEENHIITYYVPKSVILLAIQKLEETKKFLMTELNGNATSKNFNEPDNMLNYNGYSDRKVIRNIIVDCSVIDAIAIPNIEVEEYKETVLLTFFQTEKEVLSLFAEAGIDDLYTMYGKNTISVPWNIYLQIKEKMPYMISMISSDLSQLQPLVKSEPAKEIPSISSPGNEPVIGVIDTLFDKAAYFSDWVESDDVLEYYEANKGRRLERNHGTQVSSIIVDGPALNPWLDDGCGRFRVRHFGVCERTISVSLMVKKINKIVKDNPDIHVWNLSLGTEEEVSKNFISFDASALDEIQSRENVIFVVSGTNDNRSQHIGRLRVGSPADSLNSVVVNSVKRNNEPASYTRMGTVLSFFNKPDVSYYGGDFEDNEKINVCSENNVISGEYGTSFAAPWISRKLCYMIDVLGFSREVAKALLIDSAAGWDFKMNPSLDRNLIGYGVVPININEIVATPDDEIRFTLYGTAKSYKTSNYAIPVPKDLDGKYPYIARATLCYFPPCDRAQGVDYTSRELSFKFGRVKNDSTIEDINDNTQDDVGAFNDERKSRAEFRKWENTKFISKLLKKGKRPVVAYPDRMWGFSVVSKERLSFKMKDGLNFGAVITLKEITGRNRIQDFIAACMVRGYIVHEIDIKSRLEVYSTSQEEIEWE